MIIYKVTNLINNKVYIGQTIHDLNYRMLGHYRDTKRLRKINTHFNNALLKYPKSSFVWEVIDNATSHEELDEKEQYWIQYYHSNIPEFGYNLKAGGQFGGGSNSESTKIKIGLTTKEKWKNPELAKRMLEGLRKGTETCKLKARNNYKEATCKYCNKTFTYRPMDTNGVKPNFCSQECHQQYMKRLYSDSCERMKNITKLRREENDQQLKVIIETWLKDHFNDYLPIKYNKLTNLFESLSSLTNLKDARSIMRIFNFTSRKKFVAWLLKTYADQSHEGYVIT